MLPAQEQREHGGTMEGCTNKFHSVSCDVKVSDGERRETEGLLAQPNLSSLLSHWADRHDAGSLIHAVGRPWIIIKCFQWCNAGLGQATVPRSAKKKKQQKKGLAISDRSDAGRGRKKEALVGASQSTGLFNTRHFQRVRGGFWK